MRSLSFLGLTPFVVVSLLATPVLEANRSITTRSLATDRLITIPKTWGPSDRLIQKFGQHPYLSSSLLAIGGITALGATIYSVNKIASLQSQLSKHSSSTSTLTDQLKKELKEKESQITKLKQNASENTEKIKELEQEKLKLSKDIENSKKKSEEIENQINQANQELEKQKKSLQEFENKKQELQKNNQKLTKEKEDQIEKLKQELENQKKSLQEKENQIEKLNQEQLNLEEKLNTVEKEKTELNKKLQKYSIKNVPNIEPPTYEIQESTLDLTGKNRTNNAVQQKLKEQKNEITELKKQLETKNKSFPLDQQEAARQYIQLLLAYFTDQHYQTLSNNLAIINQTNEQSTTKSRLRSLNTLYEVYDWAKQLIQLLEQTTEAGLINLKSEQEVVYLQEKEKNTAAPLSRIQELLDLFVQGYEELRDKDEKIDNMSHSIVLPGQATSQNLEQYQKDIIGYKHIIYHLNIYGEKYLRRLKTNDEITKLNNDKYAEEILTIAEKIFASIKNGAEIWYDLSEETEKLTNQQITDLIWFLYYQGMLLSPVRTGPEEFSFVLNGKTKGKILFNLLRNHEKKYQRIASHLQKEHGFNEDTTETWEKTTLGTNNSYALDLWWDKSNGFEKNAELFLPVGMRTLLFKKASIEEKNFYLFKPEEHSSKDTIKHGVGFVWSKVNKLMGSKDDSLQFNKERLPKHIANQCNNSKTNKPISVLFSQNENQEYINKFYAHHENLDYRVGNEIPVNTLTDQLAEHYTKQNNDLKKIENAVLLEKTYRLRRLQTLYAIGSEEKTFKQDPLTWYNEVVKVLYPDTYQKLLKKKNDEIKKEETITNLEKTITSLQQEINTQDNTTQQLFGNSSTFQIGNSKQESNKPQEKIIIKGESFFNLKNNQD